MNHARDSHRIELAPKEADGVKALLARERDDILDRCTRCGRCFEVCPMVAYEPSLQDASPSAVVDGILDLLRERPGTAAALQWTQLCTKSGACDAHCPEPISPKMMLRLARIIALGGWGHAPQVPLKEDPDYFNKVHAFARLALSEQERGEWLVGSTKRRGAPNE